LWKGAMPPPFVPAKEPVKKSTARQAGDGAL
jgi:hypothetical protein